MKEFNPEREFMFDGKRYQYFHHDINNTANNERAVEVPIVGAKLERAALKEQTILEVGDVLWQYGYDQERMIVDLGSEREGVEKIDVMSLKKKFDFIATISSVEHVGIDVNQGHMFRCVEVVEHLMSLLNPGGNIIITFPIGYNRVLDEWFSLQWRGKVRFLVRVTKSGTWANTDRIFIKHARYGWPFTSGNAIMVGEWGSPTG